MDSAYIYFLNKGNTTQEQIYINIGKKKKNSLPDHNVSVFSRAVEEVCVCSVVCSGAGLVCVRRRNDVLR